MTLSLSKGNMIQLNFPNILTIALAGALGYGVLVGLVKVKSLVAGAGQ